MSYNRAIINAFSRQEMKNVLASTTKVSTTVSDVRVPCWRSLLLTTLLTSPRDVSVIGRNCLIASAKTIHSEARRTQSLAGDAAALPEELPSSASPSPSNRLPLLGQRKSTGSKMMVGTRIVSPRDLADHLQLDVHPSSRHKNDENANGAATISNKNSVLWNTLLAQRLSTEAADSGTWIAAFQQQEREDLIESSASSVLQSVAQVDTAPTTRSRRRRAKIHLFCRDPEDATSAAATADVVKGIIDYCTQDKTQQVQVENLPDDDTNFPITLSFGALDRQILPKLRDWLSASYDVKQTYHSPCGLWVFREDDSMTTGGVEAQQSQCATEEEMPPRHPTSPTSPERRRVGQFPLGIRQR